MRLISANSSSTSSGDSPSEGSSRISSFGSAIRPRPIASICCSPPDSVPARWRCRSASRGKIANTRLAVVLAARAAAAIGAEIEVLPHVMLGKMRRPSGTWIRPRATMAAGRSRSIGRAGEADRAAPRPQHAGDRPVERGLAGAVRAQHRDDLAGADREIDAAQDFGRAVAGVQAADREQRLRPCAPPAVARGRRRRGRDRPRPPADRRRSPAASLRR